MPWSENTQMSRYRFVADFESCLYTMTELCEKHGISRKTGYKWAERYASQGVEGLKDRSRAPHRRPAQTSAEVAQRLVELRRKHSTWGPRKLAAWLQKHEPEQAWPAASTIGGVLKREGLVEPSRRRSPRPGPAVQPRTEATTANEVWTSDFKGQFRTGDGCLCYPLTVVDSFSRFVLVVHGLPSVSGDGAWPSYERAFREYGLPEVMRTDNGSPFASSAAIAGLSRLAVRWLKLGIRLERTAPAHPEQNGRHERMHRILKAETARPPAADGSSQQGRFDEFRRIYNEQRPHEALGQRTPSELYQPAHRRYPEHLPQPEYPGHYEVRYVHQGGEIRWQGGYLFLTEALGGERVGLEEYDDGLWAVYFDSLRLARFDERERKLYG
jgi:transposase InsO family protein